MNARYFPPLLPDKGSGGVLLCPGAGKFGQIRLGVRPPLSYNYEDTGGSCEDKIPFRSSWLRHLLLQGILSS